MIKHFLFCAIALISFSACKKNKCEGTKELTVSTVGDVYEGWPLEIYSESSSYDHVQITGPNGFIKVYNSGEYFSGIQTIESTTLANSGTYTVEYWGEGECLLKSGTVDVTILPAPTPPCSMPNNTGSSSIGGIGPTSYTSAFGNELSGYYHIYGSQSTYQQMNINFNGTHRPKAGKYITSGSYYPEDGSNQCSVYLTTSYNDFFVKDNEDVYVTYEGDQLIITLCSVQFSNSVSSTDLFISAKIVVP